MLQINDRDRTHIYQSKLTEEQTQRQLVRDLVDRAFGGSASKLVLQALTTKRATPDELVEIRKLIETREGRDTGSESDRGDQ
jgi:predicted transcriptional regulator